MHHKPKSFFWLICISFKTEKPSVRNRIFWPMLGCCEFKLWCTKMGEMAAALQVNSLPAGPRGKLKNTGVVSLSLLQQIFPT